jgi:ParB/RepB/Spo0J family partition protein
MNIQIDKLLPNPEQPRKFFDPLEMQGLAQSISENGVILPISVEDAGDRYIIHDGERRWRAAKMAGMTEIPAFVIPPLNGTSKADRLVRAMVANIQRSDLNPIEEAQAFKAMRDLGMSKNAISQKIGVSTTRVATALELLDLEKPIQDLIIRGQLSHDNRLVNALKTLPAGETRIKTAKALAARSASIKAGIEACQRVNRALRSDTIPDGEVPALRIAVKNRGERSKPVWDALQQVGRLPPWILVEISAREVCGRCGLRDIANETTCKDCALVTMLQELIGASRK